MSMSDVKHLPKVSFIYIVLNGMPFIEFSIKAVYGYAHEIIVIEGAVEQCLFAANADGSSVDGTVTAIKNYPDPDAKIHFVQGIWPEKLEMHNRALELVTGDYVWLVDSDEVYKGDDVSRVCKMLFQDPTIVRVDFIPDNFWKGFDYIFISDKFLEEPCHYRRLFKFLPGMRFISHRPPTVAGETGRIVSGNETRGMGIYPYHYSYVLWSQVCQKIELYHRYGWGMQWEVNLDEWYREMFLKWTPDNREVLEERYPVWTGDKASRTRPFLGEHPESMHQFISGFEEYISPRVPAVSEEETRTIIGAVVQQQKVLRALQNIKLEEPLLELNRIIQENVNKGEVFWNIHVALAFLASVIRPDRYLEIVGPDGGGAFIQVMRYGGPKQITTLSTGGKFYGLISNRWRFIRRQLSWYRKQTGNKVYFGFTRDGSRSALKRLLNRGNTFGLIAIDDHRVPEDVWEDVECAVKLLSDRGAIVLNKLIDASHQGLLSYVYRLKLKYPFLSVLLNTSQDSGCALVLKNIDPSDLLSLGKSGHGGRGRIAGEEEDAALTSLTQVSSMSEFACRIGELFDQFTPRRIIETGTFLGEGTTKIIASLLKLKQARDTQFFSIECSAQNLATARKNLAREGLTAFVDLIHGISVPRRLLPSSELIREKYVETIEEAEIFVDHEEIVRVQRYFQETNFRGIPDDRLGFVLDLFENSPDFVLLDSGGHMGNIEFNYLINRLSAPCYIALDDINHVKHRRSFLQIQRDPRFSLKVASKEKFGFCITHFTPSDAGEPTAPTRILWLRTDSIGDNVISLPVLVRIKEAYPSSWITVLCQQHLSEIYTTCPYVDEVITFRRRQAHEDAEYRRVIVERLQELQSDICFVPVVSREELTDVFALGSRAEERIAFWGDDTNMDAAVRQLHNRFYTTVARTDASKRSEINQYKSLLSVAGIEGEALKPVMWFSPEDDAFARHVFDKHHLDPAKTVVLFPGAQDAHRLSVAYGPALDSFCKAKDFSVIVVGSFADMEISRRNFIGTACRVVDLVGKTTIRQAAALIRQSSLAVGAETGLAHIAAAVKTPHVVLLGGGHFGRFMPYADTTTAVCLPLSCFGCNWRCRYTRHYCIEDISSESISFALHLTAASPANKPRIVLQGASQWLSEPPSPTWDTSAIIGHDIPLSIIVLEQGGKVGHIELKEPMTASMPLTSNPEICNRTETFSDQEFECLLAHYRLQFTTDPIKRLVYSFKMRKLTKLSSRDFITSNIAYLKGWLRERIG